MTTISSANAIATLRAELTGRLVLPSDATYEAHRAVLYGGIDKRPAAIARVANAADVARAVRAARDNGLELAVRSGGHSIAGHSLSDGGLVIDLRDLKAIKIDANAQTAWADAGVTAGELTSATLPHGLAVGFGDTGSVGISGITLGGGIGYLSRLHGLTIDKLLAAEIVTATGDVLIADAQNHADLFWALRGGGGNFGVVTRLCYRLEPLSDFTGGLLVLPATAETVSGFMAAAAAAPDALSAIANVMPAPPMPFLPADTTGKLIILAMMAYAGDAGLAQQALSPFRALATPLADMVAPGPYTNMFPPEDPDYHPTACSRSIFMRGVDHAVADRIVTALTISDAVFSVVQLRTLGGAIARVPADATAFAHRGAPILANVAAFYTTPEDRKVRDAFVASLSEELADGLAGSYVNFVGAEGQGRIAAIYPEATLNRLRQVKKQYDPENLFRLNQNIEPA